MVCLFWFAKLIIPGLKICSFPEYMLTFTSLVTCPVGKSIFCFYFLTNWIMPTIQVLTESAIEEFKDCLENGECANESDISDLIHQLADNHVPIYNYDVLEVAMSDLRLAISEPELWPAYWKHSAVNLIMSNIYEYISNELNNRYNKNKTEK